MFISVTERLRRAAQRRGGDDGLFILFVALILVILLLVTAIVIDLGQARESDRQAVAAADAGALAGAQAITNGAIPAVCSTSSMADKNCVAAFHALKSSDITPASLSRSTSCTFHSVVSGTETCYRYMSGRATLEVTSPYAFGGDSSKYSSYVNVRICWGSQNYFAQAGGQQSSETVCGNATAYNSGSGGPCTGVCGQVTGDCVTEDNFADASDTPQIYTFNPGDWPAIGGTPNFASKGHAVTKNNEDIVVVFDGHGTELGFTGGVPNIDWEAPTTASGNTWPVTANGNNVKLPYITSPNSNNGPESNNAHGIGYVLQSMDALGKIHNYDTTLYPAAVNGVPTGNKTIIAYQLPPDGSLKPNGKSYIYHSTLHAVDSDNVVVNGFDTHCGNGDWTFTHDGKNVTTSACGENSFFGFQAIPAPGSTVTVGTVLQVFYTDESLIQAYDYNDTSKWGSPIDPTTDFGVIFQYAAPTVPGDDGVLGDPVTVPPFQSGTVLSSDPANDMGKYWLVNSDAAHSKDKFNTTIKWKIPFTTTNGHYTIYVKAYDTDNNKPGNDCGIYQFSYDFTGGSPGGSVALVE